MAKSKAGEFNGFKFNIAGICLNACTVFSHTGKMVDVSITIAENKTGFDYGYNVKFAEGVGSGSQTDTALKSPSIGTSFQKMQDAIYEARQKVLAVIDQNIGKPGFDELGQDRYEIESAKMKAPKKVIASEPEPETDEEAKAKIIKAPKEKKDPKKKKPQDDQQEEPAKPKPEPDKDLIIKDAHVKDGKLIYSYEILRGPGAGDTVGRNGSNMVHEDITHLFNKLRKHMALIEDAFKFSDTKVENLEDIETHEITDLFTVYGFSVHGPEESEKVILTGTKWVSIGELFKMPTPKVSLDGGIYLWREDLRSIIVALRAEVELYMGGKSAPKMEQGKLFELPKTTDGHDDEFGEASR